MANHKPLSSDIIWTQCWAGGWAIVAHLSCTSSEGSPAPAPAHPECSQPLATHAILIMGNMCAVLLYCSHDDEAWQLNGLGKWRKCGKQPAPT